MSRAHFHQWSYNNIHLPNKCVPVSVFVKVQCSENPQQTLTSSCQPSQCHFLKSTQSMLSNKFRINTLPILTLTFHRGLNHRKPNYIPRSFTTNLKLVNLLSCSQLHLDGFSIQQCGQSASFIMPYRRQRSKHAYIQIYKY